ncbi:PREDICTED: protein FAM50 homolog isoform X2 [Dinoponera quadriceps]|uniref:Protein FAM50 homolog n=1 Tax=Dinoponera quadriceps TaxID=609295 RepID=A0A6P3X4R4_DINQU|nr:PREDICTED: protein FAM50 homolog isoform X2 [Dinoponera quadriceps]
MAHYKGAASEAGRAMQLMKKREIAQQEIELRKKKIEDDLKIHNIENKFATHYNAVEQQLKTSTIGLVTLNEMKAKQENIVKERERKLAQKEREKEQEKERALAAKQAEKNKQKRQIQALSFNLDEDEEEEEEAESSNDEVTEVSTESKNEQLSKHIIKKIKKNPDVDTSFLPDREREEEENRLREELRQEWARKQNALKEEEIEITFSYWDGSGHRRSVIMKKGNSIYQLLQRCLEVLRREFSELKTVMADQLMYVKEDLILPHHYTFYDFIVTKARGKSGPLFTFDVHDDIRVMHDASVETEESHAGKVLLSSFSHLQILVREK